MVTNTCGCTQIEGDHPDESKDAPTILIMTLGKDLVLNPFTNQEMELNDCPKITQLVIGELGFTP